ncbi:MAG: SAM-dependent methyltransferase [Kangiellaceae bacterium]|nr:SAM-dependent methyltransferase [Kangiellaceae bacterium]
MAKTTSNQQAERSDFKLSEQAQQITDSLFELVIQRIEENDGSISFSKFVQSALYEPKLGYYQNNLQTFGEKGDFVTAPELGQLFAGCIANSLSDYIQNAQHPKILEIGAGSGQLALNLLHSLSEASKLPEQYLILEPSAALQFQQKELLAKNLPQYFSQIRWLSDLPKSFDGVIIANEVIDAIPFDRVIKQQDGWYQLQVSSLGGEFVEKKGSAISNESLPEGLAEGVDFPVGYQAEVRSMTPGWIRALYNSMNTGAVILIDYGYPQAELYHPQRAAGSLKCFINHHQHDNPFQYIGLQDITAHVDFTHVAQSAHEAGFDISGFTTQAGFLLENGITDLGQRKNESVATESTNTQDYSLSREIQQLLMPGQMGEVIKVMLLEKKSSSSIKGFSLQDHLHRL